MNEEQGNFVLLSSKMTPNGVVILQIDGTYSEFLHYCTY